jgi:anti-anti-sigma factor
MATTTRTPSGLSVTLAARGDVHVLTLAGRLDETFEDVVNGAFQKLVDRKQWGVVVDLGGLTYLNSRGVSVFIAVVDDLRAAGGDLKLAASPAQARLVLERLGVDKLLQQFDTVEKAVDAFKVPIQEFLSEGGLDVFVAGAKGKTFHASGCPKVKKLKAVKILHSKKSARDAGLKPCPKCCGR